jgi:hypothetical protein
MERSLVWSAFALGCAGWLCGLLLSRARRDEAAEEAVVARPFLVTAIALPLLVFLLTLPSRPPFAQGQGWGLGFLLGGACVLLAGWPMLRARPCAGYPLRAAALAAAPYSLALVAAAVPLLWMRDNVMDALLGVAIGWLVVSLVLYLGLTTHDSRLTTLLTSGAGFAVTLCAVAALGVLREPLTKDVKEGMWSAIALAFAAGIPFTMLLSALPAPVFARIALKMPFAGAFARLGERFFPDEESRLLAARAWRVILALVLLILLGKLLAVKAVVQPKLFYVVLVGLVASLLAWWLAGEKAGRGRAGEGATTTQRPNDPTTNAQRLTPYSLFLAALVVLCAFMAASQLMQGFGVGLMLLAAWLPLGMALPAALEREQESAAERPAGNGQTAHVLLRLLLFGALLLLFRLYNARYEYSLEGVSLEDHYALFGFLTGAVLPMLLASLPIPADSGAPLRLLFVGAITLAVPGAILLLWGSKCALALMAGLALASLWDTGTRGHGDTGTREETYTLHPTPYSLFALAVALALCQWTGHVLPWAEMARAQKIRLLTEVVGGIIVLMLLADYGGRIAGWMRRMRQGRAAPASGEGAPR